MVHNGEKEEAFREKKKGILWSTLNIFDNWNDSKFLEKHYVKADPREKTESTSLNHWTAMQVPSNSSLTQTISESRKEREFPGGLVVRILGFNCCGPGSIPCLETEVLQGAWHSQKKKKKKIKIPNSFWLASITLTVRYRFLSLSLLLTHTRTINQYQLALHIYGFNKP